MINQKAEEMDALTMSKSNNIFPSPLVSNGTQIVIVMAGKKGTGLSSGKYRPKVKTEGDFIVTP